VFSVKVLVDVNEPITFMLIRHNLCLGFGQTIPVMLIYHNFVFRVKFRADANETIASAESDDIGLAKLLLDALIVLKIAHYYYHPYD
jgi:hypothetical protein